MDLEELSKSTIKKIWEMMSDMQNIHPLVVATKEAKTEEELLKKIQTLQN